MMHSRIPSSLQGSSMLETGNITLSPTSKLASSAAAPTNPSSTGIHSSPEQSGANLHCSDLLLFASLRILVPYAVFSLC